MKIFAFMQVASVSCSRMSSALSLAIVFLARIKWFLRNCTKTYPRSRQSPSPNYKYPHPHPHPQSAGQLEGSWSSSSSKNLAIRCLQWALFPNPCFWHLTTFQPWSFSPMTEVWKDTSLKTDPTKPPWVTQAPSSLRAIPVEREGSKKPNPPTEEI